MKCMLWIFHFFVNVGSPNDPGQIYTVPQCMKRMGTIVLGSGFVLIQKNDNLFWSNRDAKLDMYRASYCAINTYNITNWNISQSTSPKQTSSQF